MKGKSVRTRLITLLAAVAFAAAGALALSPMIMDEAYAAGDATNYDYDATAAPADLEAMPGVYRVQVDMNSEAEPKTIGIPSVAKQNLTDGATKELPAIIMGAAVNYEVRTGATEFTPISGAELLPPYSYFRWGIMDEQVQEPDGTTSVHKKLSGFDGSYYIVRVDVSKVIADAKAKAEAEGGNLEGKYLHVRQENNKALLVATGMTDYSFVWSDTSKENNKGGCKAAAYSLANDAEAMLDTTGSDNQTPYLDVILMSSAKNVAGADAGGQDAPVSNVDLSFYVDGTKDYKPWLKALDPNNMPTFPYTIQDDQGNNVTFQTESDYNQALTTKFFDESNATAANSATKYRLMGEDLEIDVAVDVNNEPDDGDTDTQGRDWLGENMDFWSMEKAIAHEDYDNHTIIMICEVPVLDGLSISGTKERSVVLDVNSFDIQIANNTEEGKAGLTIGNNASLRIKDGSNTAGAELAIGNNANMIIESGGTMIIDETCTTEAEFDAASTVDPSTDPAHYLSGEITVKEGGRLSNWGVINIEGTEGKPLDPSQQEQTIRDKQSADILVESGGLLDNYGCISLKGTLHILGMLNNYSRFSEIIHAGDPDKGYIDYHKGIQVTWKDDVTQEGVVPGVLYVGIDAEGNIVKDAVVNNYGDIVLVPGTIELYGTFNNTRHPDPDLDYEGHLYLCTVDEAIIPIVNPDNPLEVEKRVTLETPKESVFDHQNGTFNNEDGVLGYAKVELLHNGVLGELTPLTEDEVISKEQEAIAAAEKAVEDAQKAMDELLKTENPSTADIKTAYEAVVKAQNALAKAQARLSAAEQVKVDNLNKQVEELNQQLTELSVVDISNYAATLEQDAYEWTGEAFRPAVTVKGLTSEDFDVTYDDRTDVGTSTVTITAKGEKYKGSINATFEITKAAQTIGKVTPTSKKVKAKKGKVKKNTTVALKAVTIGEGAVTFSKANKAGKSKITVAKTGKITVRKGLKKGTYKVRVKISKAETANYNAATRTVTVKIIVK